MLDPVVSDLKDYGTFGDWALVMGFQGFVPMPRERNPRPGAPAADQTHGR